MAVEFHDNSYTILQQLQQKLQTAATEIGYVAVELVTDQMLIGYENPIWKTGDLVRSIKSDVSTAGGKVSVTVGSPMEYAPFVHDGTSKMAGRPFLRDALLSGNGKEILQEVLEETLSI